MKTVVILGIVQALFLISLLLPKTKNSLSHSRLVGWLFLMILNQFYFLNTISPLVLPTPLLILGASIGLLLSPVYYFYVRSLTTHQAERNYWDLIHWVPFVVFNGLFLSLYWQDPGLIYFKHGFIHSRAYPTVYHYYGYVLALVPVFYYLLSFRLIKRFEKQLKENYSSIDEVNLSWLVRWMYAALLFFVFAFLIIFLSTQYQVLPQSVSFPLIGIFNTVYIFYLGYFGLKKTHFYSDIPFFNEDDKQNKPKYQKSTLDTYQAEVYKEKLLLHLENNKSYLNENLNLAQLAAEMAMSSNTLSQVINQGLGTTFLKLINQYRVEQVKARMADERYRHYTLLGIALECGFNSKSTFINAFKEFTGSTPAAYKNTTSRSGQ